MTLSLASPRPIGYAAAKMRSSRSVGSPVSLVVAALRLGGLVGLGLAAGCTPLTDTTATTTSTAVGNPTVSVDPGAFLVGASAGFSVPCTAQPGGMESYVATVTDLGPLTADGTPGPYPIALPSSPPTACSQSLYFAAAIDHHYEAVIDGYEEPASELVPVCSVAPAGGANAPASGGACTTSSECFALGCYGSCLGPDATTPCAPGSAVPCECIYTPALGDRHMVAPGTAKLVTPRWTTPQNHPCGYGSTDVGIAYANVSITPCAPLVDASPGGTTGLEIVPASALGTFGCAASTTVQIVVTKIDVIPADVTLTPVAALACGVNHTYTGLAAGKTFKFTLNGYQKDDVVPSLKAACAGSTVKGLVVTATCDPFVPVAP
jgi:hypothetical protein